MFWSRPTEIYNINQLYKRTISEKNSNALKHLKKTENHRLRWNWMGRGFKTPQCRISRTNSFKSPMHTRTQISLGEAESTQDLWLRSSPEVSPLHNSTTSTSTELSDVQFVDNILLKTRDCSPQITFGEPEPTHDLWLRRPPKVSPFPNSTTSTSTELSESRTDPITTRDLIIKWVLDMRLETDGEQEI